MKSFAAMFRGVPLDSWLWFISLVSAALMVKSSTDPVPHVLKGTWLEAALSQFPTGNQILSDLSVGMLAGWNDTNNAQWVGGMLKSFS